MFKVRENLASRIHLVESAFPQDASPQYMRITAQTILLRQYMRIPLCSNGKNRDTAVVWIRRMETNGDIKTQWHRWHACYFIIWEVWNKKIARKNEYLGPLSGIRTVAHHVALLLPFHQISKQNLEKRLISIWTHKQQPCGVSLSWRWKENSLAENPWSH